jgi:hypothetical protein
MAVIDVREIFQARDHDIDFLFRRNYTRVFRILTDDAHTGARAVRESLPVKLGDYYQTVTESDRGSLCMGGKIQDEGADDGKSWIATVQYGPLSPLDWGAGGPSPMDKPMEISWDAIRLDEVCMYDVDGNPILNTALDPYIDPPVTRDGSRPMLILVRNEPSFNEDFVESYRDAINVDEFWGKAPKTMKVEKIAGQRVNQPDYGWYYTVRYEFAYNSKTWVKDIVETGYRQLSTDGTRREQIIINGIPPTSPVTLDASGRYFKPDDPTQAVHTRWRVYPELPFDVFNLKKPEDLPPQIPDY